ncbi:hypothetical protein EPN81_00260 [Patescibacteria group bacterium]|nr:MAG: hypothetical protein EPN81_00260 [Patescibacteria group bacterium]
MFHRLELNIFCVLFLAFFLFNASLLHSVSLGAFLLCLYLIVFGWELGGVLVASEKAVLRWWIGIWILISSVLIILTASYYIWAMTSEVVIVCVLLTPIIILWVTRRFKSSSLFTHAHDLWHEHRHKLPRLVWLVSALLVFLFTLFFTTLTGSPVTEAVRSVWERLPVSLFLLFTLSASLVFGSLWRGRERAIALIFVCVLVLACLSVAAIAFPIGFGFDSFIHKATESHLAEFGTITPKPLYYIGQYALVLFAYHGFQIPIDLADTFLVPVLTALLLPMAWYFAAVHITRKRGVAMLTLTGIFLLPLSPFIVTTPQALANLWTLLLVLASVPYLLEKEHPRLRVLFVSAVATLLIHPIAGIPTLLYFMFLSTDPHSTNPRTPKTNRIVRLLLIACACIVLPLSFVANSLMSDQSLGLNWASLNPVTWVSSLNLAVFFENRFSPLMDLVYLYGRSAMVILVLIAAFAWIEYHRDLSARFRALLLMVLALTVNYLIMSTILEFTFLIDYERLNYATRLLPLISFFLVPLLILGLGHLFVNIKGQPLILRACVLVGVVAIASSAFYLSYPRRDAYETNHGFNVSQADIDAVHLVESLADGQPYLALANQSVSAAAIQEIGFRYYGDLFFYPIPTGGELYASYLEMNESPTREMAQETLRLVPQHGDVTTVFFLVNNYWWDAPRIIETAKTTADDWRSLGEGQIYVFRWDL